MAEHGFDVEEDILLKGVNLNISPFLCGKGQFSTTELIKTQRIASLRIHVERATCVERIKNCHVFDRPLPASFMDIANRPFFVCYMCMY